MVRILGTMILCLSLSGFSRPSWAQDDSSSRTASPRKQIATIIFAGLAGGVLGLSTLSFYGRPQDKLSNVPMGAGVGVIIGAIYTTYKAAAQPREFFDGSTEPSSLEPEVWHQAQISTGPSVLGAGWQWTF